MPNESDYFRKYFIVFVPKRKRTWWNWMLNDEIFHCYALTYATPDTTLKIDPFCTGIKVDIINENVNSLILKVYEKNKNIIEVYTGDMVSSRIKGITTCVSIIKDLIGLRNPFIITSKQLFDYLRKG